LAIERADAQAWVIATRTESHVPLAAMVLTHGSAALVEKPLAADLATARQLERLVRPDSSNLMLGHIVLFAREFRRLLTEVRRRGPVRFFNAVRHRPAALAKKFPEENPLRFTMVHDLYMALALMNGADPEHMSARMRPRSDGSGGFDVACADLRWPGGAWGSLTASFLTPPGMPEDGFDRFEVFGADWAARVDLNPQPLQVFSDKAQWPLGLEIDDDPAAPSGWLAEELRQFCRVVAGKAAVPLGCRYRDALQLQRWMECLEGSARAVTADAPAQKDEHV
jgi:predicted dehydrogenase